MKSVRRSVAICLCCIATTACHTAHTADFIATPAGRLVCEAAGPRPKIPQEYQIQWNQISTVAQAHQEHDRYVATIHDREGIVASYILSVEGKLYVCGANMAWRRDWEAGLAKTHKPVHP